MEVALVVLIGLFFAVAIYLLLSRAVIRMLLGMVILGNAVNLLIFTSGRLTAEIPPIIPGGEHVPIAGSANPLPHFIL